MKTENRTVTWAIWLILLSAVCGWILFEIGIFTDLMVDSDVITSSDSSTAPYGPDAVQRLRPSKYLLFAAIAVFGIGSLIAQKRLVRVRSQAQHPIPLAKAGQEFANTAIIISLSMAAWAAIAVFMESFFEYANADVSIALRLLNTYLPIILYTALVVSVLLAAFVFRKHQPAIPDKNRDQQLPHTGAHTGEDPARVQRNVGLSFAIPIVSVAVALIFGLIVFDLTQTALQVWIWVIIQLVIGGGIIVGALLAQKAIDAYRRIGSQPAGASIGAKNLNFVLSIIFAAVLSFMSLIYGVTAIEQLRVQPGLSLSVYANEAKEAVSSGDSLDLSALTILVSGTDLERNSGVSVSVESVDASSDGSEIEIISGEADRDGNFWAEQSFDESLNEGEYVLTLAAVSADGSALERDLRFTVISGDGSEWPNGTDAYAQDAEGVRVMPVTLGWVLSDLLPALLLLKLAALVIYVTLRIRNAPHEKILT